MKIVIRKKVKKKVPVFLDDILSNACMKQKKISPPAGAILVFRI